MNPRNEIVIAKHLSGGNRPEIVCYHPEDKPDHGLILDSKAYKSGFTIPSGERDKMVRYIEEYITKNQLQNPNEWWKNLKGAEYPGIVGFGFISNSFLGHYRKQLDYIMRRTKIKGSSITTEHLLKTVEDVLSEKGNVIDFFKYFLE
ncbi:Type-2 restriction enzyme FokI [Limihaloglobus sulfuriphilus]|uniref:Type-2 restriction enzyme FokI n=1 Tax=Limihaloglobus sulfuriphilus TaxID=1851148 RepID=A0A1Q2MCG4_9BACT|nr:restriction endonuclease FokI C-terminal domain-containing protein [Limihaloglobus sulfuriphilus]AQQ70391.1 Type-2 restriction enzyme FokI [Limihaloglobus sulfuriphilus]